MLKKKCLGYLYSSTRLLIRNKIFVFVVVFGFVIRVFGLFFEGFKYDTLEIFYNWGSTSYTQGLSNFWHQTHLFKIDYPPLGIVYMYLVYLPCNSASCFIFLFKMYSVFCDFLLSCVFFIYAKSCKKIVFSVIWLNPSLIFIGAYWGQIDSLVLLLLLLSILFFFSKRYFISIFLYVLSFSFKLNTLLFIPVFLFYFSIKRYLIKFVIYLLSIFVLINAYFFSINNTLTIKVLLQPVIRSDFISNGGANFWSIFYEWSVHTPYSAKLLSVSVPIWGTILFLIFLLLYFYKFIVNFKRNRKINLISLLELGVVLNFLFFFFTTKIHSRYGFFAAIVAPVVVLFSGGVFNKKYFLLFSVLFNLSFFLNQLIVFLVWYPMPLLSFITVSYLKIISLLNLLCFIVLTTAWLNAWRLKNRY